MASRDAVPSTRPTNGKAKPPSAAAHDLGMVGANHSFRPSHEPDSRLVRHPIPPPSLGGRQRDRGFFSSDDTALTKQILATHAPDIEDLNVKPLLSIVEDILRLSKPSSSTDHTSLVNNQVKPHLDTLDSSKAIQSSPHQDAKVLYNHEHDSEIVRLLAFPISKISCEIICKCSAGGEAHSVTMDLLKSLSNYSWDAKVVIIFAAFAVNYGEFWLVEQNHTRNMLAKHIATLKDLPYVMEHAGKLEKKFEAVLDLLNAVLNVIHCLIEFKELPSVYISHDAPEVVAATAHIPTAVYWIIRSLLACASTLLNLIGSGHEYITSTAESWEILSLAHKLSVILEHLRDQLAVCKGLVERKKAEDAYTAFKKLIESTHIENMKVLRAMIRARDDQRPLYDGSKRINERLEVLRSKYVLLLISDLDIPHEELNVLHMIYNQQARRHEYEVLWLPIVNPTTPMTGVENTVFYDLRNNSMPWYSVDHPALIEPVAVRYIREELKFVHMPMLIVLDPHGKPSKTDALPMMWIWGSDAFPFTKDQEWALWRDKTWNIELLADSIDPRIQEWMRGDRVVCLYGGEDMEWIRKFTLAARAAAAAMHVPLEMLYVGKRNPREKVRRCHETIEREKLSHVFHPTDYYDYVWYFWVRLWSMWNSKKQVGMSVESDHIMQQIMDILTYDSSEEGWAVFSRGNHEITKGKGDVVLPVMEGYAAWEYKVDRADKFVPVLDEEIRRTHPEHHCNRLILPGHAGYVPDHVVCSECGRTMDKFVLYRCCTD
ncbi:protein SIEVE ELEMENT OCCLUSION B-like [Salvia hispanica]|uniref:protein SIEVE ELEMENT OCCLUSION B-like n=1 Tax=Salvia hispanica TaxID=49212 RepID=UPI0020097940|nr:protein SIEVE ELEMENT OCCLUSION B-like [Salvia hispanica]